MSFGQISVDGEDEQKETDLDRVRMLTQMMREHQSAVVRLGSQRRDIIRRLRKSRIPYRVIAEQCGVTDQALFADLRKHPETNS